MSKSRGLAAFVLGALFAGTLFDLAVQQELVMLNVPLLVAAALAGGVLGLLLAWGVRRRRHLLQVAPPSPVLAATQASQAATSAPLPVPTSMSSLPVGSLSPDGSRFWNGAKWEEVE